MLGSAEFIGIERCMVSYEVLDTAASNFTTQLGLYFIQQKFHVKCRGIKRENPH